MRLGKVPKVWDLFHPENIFLSILEKEASKSPLIPDEFLLSGWVGAQGGVSQDLLLPLKRGLRFKDAPQPAHSHLFSYRQGTAPILTAAPLCSEACLSVIRPLSYFSIFLVFAGSSSARTKQFTWN